jgi:hypothetical protein
MKPHHQAARQESVEEESYGAGNHRSGLLAAYAAPFVATASPKEASATEGAAPNKPAKLFGFNRSPRTANKETIVPPIRNRTRSCVMKVSPLRFCRQECDDVNDPLDATYD